MKTLLIVASFAAGLAAAPTWAAETHAGSHAAHANPVAAAREDAGRATASSGLPMADAEVRKIDVRAGKVTLRHGRLENLNMAPMTMVFGVKDPTWLQSLKVGDKVRVAVDRVDGVLTVVAVERGN